MTLTKTEICNFSLTALGQPAVADVDTDITTGGIQAKRHYDPTLNSLLRSHPWQFASMWADLVRPTILTSGTSTGTNSATTLNDTGQAWTVNVYAGCWLWVTDGTGEGQIRRIVSNTATQITTDDDSKVTPTTAGYEVWKYPSAYQWDYQYQLPSDFLRLEKADPSDERFEVEGAYLKTDSDTMSIRYVRLITDPTLFDALFVEAMTVALAAKLVMPLLQDKVWQVELEKKLDRILQRARAVNRTEVRAQKKPLTWNEARL